MKIIITGGHGQLGSDVASILKSKNDIFSFGSKELDIGDPKKVHSLISQHKPDILINCAAYTAVDDCETEKELAWRVNAAGPAHLALAMEACGGRIIHISTDYVFNGNKPSNESYNENDSVNPLSEYGRSKLAGEQAIEKHCSNHLILRTAWLYGWQGNNFLKTILRLALTNPTRELKVVNDQYGSLTWTVTLARQIQTLLSSDLQGIIHATAEGSCTWYQGACYFLDAMKIPYRMHPCSSSEYPTPAHRPSNSILTNNKLNQTGLSVFSSWQDDIDRFIALHKKELLEEAMQA